MNVVVNRLLIEPADNKWELAGKKLWMMTDRDADVRNAFAQFQVANVQQSLERIIDLAIKFTDMETSVPMMFQGEKTGMPETLGRCFFTVTGNSASTSRVAVLDIATRTSRVIVDGAERGRYLPTGHLVYWRARTLFAAMFDLKTLTVTGSETPMLEGISSDFAISDTGVLVLSKYPTLLGRFKQTLEWLIQAGRGSHWRRLQPRGRK